jgi:CrcB protein
LRHGAGQLVDYPGPPGWPWATFAVNLSGSLALGLLYGLTSRWSANCGTAPGTVAKWRLFLGTGLLGGFTTYSAFSLEAVELSLAGATSQAWAYVGASLVGGVACAALGLALGGTWSARLGRPRPAEGAS